MNSLYAQFHETRGEVLDLITTCTLTNLLPAEIEHPKLGNHSQI